MIPKWLGLAARAACALIAWRVTNALLWKNIERILDECGEDERADEPAATSGTGAGQQTRHDALGLYFRVGEARVLIFDFFPDELPTPGFKIPAQFSESVRLGDGSFSIAGRDDG